MVFAKGDFPIGLRKRSEVDDLVATMPAGVGSTNCCRCDFVFLKAFGTAKYVGHETPLLLWTVIIRKNDKEKK